MVPVIITAEKAFSMETVQTHEFMYVVEELRATFISKEALSGDLTHMMTMNCNLRTMVVGRR